VHNRDAESIAAGITLTDRARASESSEGVPSTLTFAQGRFAVRGELGSGGMGRVLVAHDMRLDRDVAIKVISNPIDEEQVQRFAKELRAACAISHPNVVAVYDAGEQGGQPFLVTELLRGSTLRARLERGALPPDEALDYARQLCRGLAAIHDAGIVHRDLKPENLFLLEGGQLKVLDFGIAKVAFRSPAGAGGTPASEASTDAGRILGTPAYMAPEQFNEGPVDERADIFAFGAVLYEMLSGRRAFTGGSKVETAYAVMRVAPAPLPRDVPAPIRAVVERCLRKDPEERFVSIRDVMRHLEMSDEPRRPAIRRLQRGRTVAFAGLGALAVAIALLLGLQFRGGHNSAPVKRVAVLPFTVMGGNEFRYLREGLVDLLTADLSEGEVRAADPGAVIKAAGGSGETQLDGADGARLGRRLDADYFTLGSVVAVDKRLRIQVRLFDREHPEEPLAAAQAAGDSNQLFHLVDEISWQLRNKMGGGKGTARAPVGRMVRAAEELTSSPDALRSYLEGEAALRRWDWRGAARAFQRACAIDPGFALAYYRLAVVVSIESPERSDAALESAKKNAARLSPRDQKLVAGFDAFHRGDLAAAEQIYRTLLQQYPDDVEGWYQLGETLFHLNPVHDRPANAAAEPFRRALVLDPEHGGALVHLMDLAQMEGDKADVAALATRYLQATPPDSPSLPIRWSLAWAQGDVANRARLFEEMRDHATPRQQVLMTLERALWQQDDLADALGIARILTQRGSATERAEGYQRLGIVQLAKGRRVESGRSFSSAAELQPDGPHRAIYLFLSTLPFFPLDDVAIARAEEEALTLTPQSPFAALWRGYVLGALAVRKGELDRAEKLAGELAKLPSFGGMSLPADYSLAIRAQVAVAREQPRVALDLLRQQQLAIPYRYSGTFFRLAEQGQRGDLFARIHNTEEALRWYNATSFYSPFETIYASQSLLKTAEILEHGGSRAAAETRYRLFIERWFGCDPDLRGILHLAQNRLVRLGPDTPASASRSH